jgi:glycosyltransferase involved in cell wall biosynthesis
VPSATPALRVGIEATSLLGPRTGVGALTAALVERLAGEESVALTAILVSWRGRGQLGPELPAGVATRAVAFPARLAHRLWQHLDWPSVGGLEVVHGPNFVVPPGAGAAELVTVHDFGPWHFPELVTHHARAYPRLVRRALDRGAHMHVVSDFVAAEAAELLGVEPERLHVIHNGFDRGRPGDPDRGRALAGAERYVLALGTIEPRKDLPTLVAAMAEVWATEQDMRLVVAGGGGWGTDAFEAALTRWGAGGRVARLGYVADDDRSDLLAGATCLAYPSIYEGFGLPPLEAMAASTPVVTTTAGALPEVCGDAAALVAPGDSAAMAAAIVEVVTDDTVNRRLVEAGCRRVDAFSWDRAASEMCALYRDLAER